MPVRALECGPRGGVAAPVPKHWELGLSDLDDTSLLHG